MVVFNLLTGINSPCRSPSHGFRPRFSVFLAGKQQKLLCGMYLAELAQKLKTESIVASKTRRITFPNTAANNWFVQLGERKSRHGLATGNCQRISWQTLYRRKINDHFLFHLWLQDHKNDE
jgi:hypothetical protein